MGAGGQDGHGRREVEHMRRSRKADDAVREDQLAAMEAVVAASGGDPEHPRTRRQLLTLAGGALAGGTALALAGATPAGAADGDAVIVGNDHVSASQTSFNGSSVSTAALHVAAYTTDAAGISAAGNGTSTTSMDVKLNGTGRLAQVNNTTGSAQPSHQIQLDGIGGGANPVHEIVRSDTGIIWATTGTGTGNSTAWKRINAVRLDNPNGDGTAFAPFRLLDTRSGAAQNSNTTYNVDVSGSPNIPDDVVGVFGNITAVTPSFGGFLKLFPRTTGAAPNTSAVNFSAGGVVANSFFVGVGRDAGWTGGQISYRGGDAAGTYHVLIDITAYVQ